MSLGVIVQSNIPHSFDLINVDGKNLWILDSGATDHLSRSSKYFVSYIPYVGNKTIRIVDGSLTPISGKGKISLCAGFSLHNVLHVSRFPYNLLSISKITHELKCKAIFLPDSIFFQDLSSKKMIGCLT